ncbi:bifunctional salicylyl-CoA 5-hydroxylase/oxidoreductase [Pseudoduganella umbonata]|uniref:Anthraniloyl-CoA monooxygenase n=1 Tax=Pseudoduganella umbonata TaxID=864828 RepID=A0A4P8HY44_9BURK|nr:bifunctional salicylyl-CoA 5-hydroxylase/oxidoreductase [Pseudoduganella umbonata]MBB3223219.1 anthraniloyl-CoA monooxygenase [Pseudoduganella umbonata]QCP13858.1 bifunctional salicylyl-CoA 5-hydroxylase/oxidoreductase [Pseudoduganella umbonata]
MNVLCVGGGPAGLYSALLLKKALPARRVVVVERNRPHDTFGWGVVFSDQTLDKLLAADEPSARDILAAFNHWDDIEVFYRGARMRSGGHGFAGIGRKRLLEILQRRCEALGVELVFETEVTDEQALAARYGAGLVIAADGLNSRVRARHAQAFAPQVEARQCRFAWLGTTQRFDAFTFDFRETEHGWFQAHIYQFDAGMSTFIVEAPESVWRAAGLEDMTQQESIAFCERLFADRLDGHPLMSNAAHLRGADMWLRFPRIACERWVHWPERSPSMSSVPVVLAGDAAHSAHFSIGSGTRLALEDAIALAGCIGAHGDLPEALAAYEGERRVEVLKLQSAARNSMEWFENVARYAALDAPQFAYAMLARSQRLSHENLRLRDRGYVADYERWFARRAFAQAGLPAPDDCAVPPMFTPFRVRGLVLKNRIVVSPMAQYSAVDGVVGDWHLQHLGARAVGGAALVMAEMTCVSADARITPWCPGLYEPGHTAAWRRIVAAVHATSDAKIGIQLGHAGAKGSTRAMWDGIDQPLEEGNWPLVSASPQQHLEGVSQVAREASTADMARIEADFVRAARAADEAGFDWLELHCAHGYLLSSFISPLTNRRTDEYGGSLENRCRFPLRVFAAVRAAWPAHKPMSVRISAHDWVEGGITPDDAVRVARLFKAAGTDLIDCSSGQVSKRERPVFGRMYQAPFADRVRNEAGIATMAVGAISEADHANGIVAAGRADLCAVGRPHLANPAWTLAEAARIGYRAQPWPKQYLAGKAQLERHLDRNLERNTERERT